jgi:hypothetical protein
MRTFVFICKTDKSKPVKQEVNGTSDTSHFSIPWFIAPQKCLMTLIAGPSTCPVRLTSANRARRTRRRIFIRWRRRRIRRKRRCLRSDGARCSEARCSSPKAAGNPFQVRAVSFALFLFLQLTNGPNKLHCCITLG